MKIAITTNGTDNYLYALNALLQALNQNVFEIASRRKGIEILLILVGNESIRKFKDYAESLGFDRTIGDARCQLQFETCEDWRETKKYKEPQNLMVSQMRMAGANAARRWNADALWFLDADVIPAPNSLACSVDMLEFDGGYYGVAFCPYPSQGGGSYLGGHGNAHMPIFPDFRPEERDVPEELEKELEKAREAFEEDSSMENHEALQKVRHQIDKECPPKHGANIMKHNAEFGWRRRGWLDFAYPGIGEGAVVPIDWWGFGCTLLGKKALTYMDFTGYYGAGTEDLYTVHQRIAAHGIKSCCITHCPASHVLRFGDERAIVLCYAHHELMDEESKGHLRRRRVPFFGHNPGEPYRSEPEKQKIHSDDDLRQDVEDVDGED